MKTIGVLTSGGDSPGMNAAVRSVVRAAINKGMKVYGIERGYSGVIDGDMKEMTIRSVSDIIHRGGTVLKTARCPEFVTKEGQLKGIAKLKEKGIEGVIVIGGDGSFMGAKALSGHGFPAIGIPGTIDNDLAYTDYTLGFDTACNTILDAINKLRDTMTSHDRICMVEVMGRHCGDLALYAGIGGGAEYIIVPERKNNIKELTKCLNDAKARGKVNGVIVFAEGVGKMEDVAEELKKATGLSIRTTVLGHIQRGGAPTMQDRLLGTSMGVYAVDLLSKGIGNRIVGIKENKIFDMDVVEGCAMKKEFDEELYKTASIMAL